MAWDDESDDDPYWEEDFDDPWLGDQEPESYTEACPNCGADLAEDAVQCWNCGVYPTESQRRKLRSPLWIAFILLLIVVVLIFTIL